MNQLINNSCMYTKSAAHTQWHKQETTGGDRKDWCQLQWQEGLEAWSIARKELRKELILVVMVWMSWGKSEIQLGRSTGQYRVDMFNLVCRQAFSTFQLQKVLMLFVDVQINPLTRRFKKKCLPENAKSFLYKGFYYML